MFSTTFSGTIVVWLPLITAYNGLGSVGRIFTFLTMVLASQVINPNFRIIGSGRRHTTLSEFYTDRFRSNTIACQMIFIYVVAEVFKVAIQLNSLRQTAEAITGNMFLADVLTMFFAVLIFICESMGGFSVSVLAAVYNERFCSATRSQTVWFSFKSAHAHQAIAMTDAFQSGVMIAMYCIAPFIVIYNW